MDYLPIEIDSEKVKYVRDKLHLCQWELGELLGFAQGTIGAYERSITQRFTPKFEKAFLAFCFKHGIYFKKNTTKRRKRIRISYNEDCHSIFNKESGS